MMILMGGNQIKKILTIIFLLTFCSTLGDLNRNGFFKEMSSPEKVIWKASWIRRSGDIERQNFFFIAKGNFALPFSPEKANLFISCQARCEITANNLTVQRIGLYSNPPYQYYDQIDIKKYLHKGENTIVVLGYNEGVDMFSAPAKPDGLIAQIEVSNGWRKKIIVTDQKWKMATPTAWDRENSLRISDPSAGFEEIIDMSKYFQDWSPENTQAWERAEVIGKPPQNPWSAMIARSIPYMNENHIPLIYYQKGHIVPNTSFIKANVARFINESEKNNLLETNQSASNIILSDNQFASFSLGKQIIGGLEICFETNQKGIIDIGYAETRNGKNQPDTGRMMFQGDRLANPTSGCWRSFHPRSFKYVILALRDFQQPITIKTVKALRLEYPAELINKNVTFGDPLLDKIYQVGVDTLKVDMQETFMDCPVRERSQYLGDGRVETLVAYSLFKDTSLQKKLLAEFAQSQMANGYFYSNYPTGHKVDIPTYTLQWANMLWEYYNETNDAKTLTELYPTLERLLLYFSSLESDNGLISHQPDWWIFIDHGSPIAVGKYNLALQISYYAAIADARKIAEVLKKTNTAKRYEDKANKLKENINALFWRSDVGLYDDCLEEKTYCNHFSQQANYWVLYWDAAYSENQKILLKNLIANKYKLPSSSTPYFNGFIADVLFHYGEQQEAIKLIKNYWGGMLAAGATTWWESFDPKTKTTNPHFGESSAHAWGSWPTYLLLKYLSPSPTPSID